MGDTKSGLGFEKFVWQRIEMIHIRPYTPNGRTFVFSLAPRLAIVRQPWRDLTFWLKTVDEWLTESIEQHNQQTMVSIAEDERGEELGFAPFSHSDRRPF